MKKPEKKPKPLSASEIGSKGGKATRDKLGKEHYSRIAKLRHAKIKKQTTK